MTLCFSWISNVSITLFQCSTPKCAWNRVMETQQLWLIRLCNRSLNVMGQNPQWDQSVSVQRLKKSSANTSCVLKNKNKPADLWSFEEKSRKRKSWCAAILLSCNTSLSLGVKLWGLDICVCGGGSHKVTRLYHNLKESARWQGERSGSDEDRGSLTWSDFMIRCRFPTLLGVYCASINHSSVSRCQGGTGHFPLACTRALETRWILFFICRPNCRSTANLQSVNARHPCPCARPGWNSG